MDLTVGLHPDVHWMAGTGETAAWIRYVANMPTEALTSPDARRTEGTIRATQPFPLRVRSFAGSS